MVGSWTVFFAAIEHLSIGVATVLFNVQPFWLMAIGAAWLGERVTKRQWAAAGVALAGLALASGLASGGAAPLSAGDGAGRAAGLALCLVGSLAYAFAALVGRAASRVSPLAQVWWQCMVGAVVLAPWALAHGLPQAPAAWAWLAALGVLHTGLAYVLLFGGMARLGAGRLAVLQFIYPAAAIAVDWLAVGHRMDAMQLAGAALIVAALFAGRRGAG
jgi:drug/metabolite transporter (DMT)-like permease